MVSSCLPYLMKFSFLVYRPKWPSSSFVSSDGLITAMAYRLPHVVCIIIFLIISVNWPYQQLNCSKVSIVRGSDLTTFQVMGDRSGNIRWWDVTTGHSSSFNTHREGIRRIKFSPVVPGDRSRGLIAVLFYDNTFSIFDLVSMKYGNKSCSLKHSLHSCYCDTESTVLLANFNVHAIFLFAGFARPVS